MPPEPEDFDITEFLFVVKATSALLTLKFPPMFPVVFAVTSESTLTLEPLTSKLNPNPLKSLFAVALWTALITAPPPTVFVPETSIFNELLSFA